LAGAEQEAILPDWLSHESDRLCLRVSPRGGAVVDGYTNDGRPFLRPYQGKGAFDVAASACFPLVPIGNRVEGNAFLFAGRKFALAPSAFDPLYIHGDGWLGTWQVGTQRQDVVELGFDKPAGEGSPFVYSARQSFRLVGARLELAMSVTNTGDVALPFGLGFHPYFPRTPLTALFAPASDWWSERGGYLPGERIALTDDVDFSTPRRLPQRWLNNGFEGWNRAARIVWPEFGLGLDIEATPALGRYMLYAPDSDRSFFCFEPMSHTPNALKHVDADPMGLRIVSPGESFDAGFAMSVFDWSD